MCNTPERTRTQVVRRKGMEREWFLVPTEPLLQVLGSISGSGKITLEDRQAPADLQPPVDLDLEKVLGKMPRKTFKFTRRQESLDALDVSRVGSPTEALSRVLRLPAVGSKRFLTTKVDRCVTGMCFPIWRSSSINFSPICPNWHSSFVLFFCSIDCAVQCILKACIASCFALWPSTA